MRASADARRMRSASSDLAARLRKPLPPVIVLHGEEPLLIEESADQVRAAALAQGYQERLRLTVDPHFHWEQLDVAGRSLSLFAERRLVELRMPTGRPGDAGGKALAAYATDPPADTLLLVLTGRLDARARQTAWFRALQAAGFSRDHKSVRPEHLTNWIRARLQARGLRAEAEAVALLAHLTEGNLLAASQEIEKIALSATDKTVRTTDVLASTADHSRFNVYALADTCLAGQTAKVLRILAGLRREGTEPVLLMWALAREMRTLALIAWGTSRGQSLAQLFRAQRVWSTRQALIRAALGRHPPETWFAALQRMAHLDRVLKGRQSGNIWLELEQFCVAICVPKPPTMNP